LRRRRPTRCTDQVVTRRNALAVRKRCGIHL
jgi:hypothetical protein